MIANEQLAAEISERVLRANEILNEMAQLVRTRGAEDEIGPFFMAIGKVSGELLLSLANPLYKEHPNLKPPGMD